MPTNSDRYAVGNYYHSPQPKRRRVIFGRYLAAILGLLALLALLSLHI